LPTAGALLGIALVACDSPTKLIAARHAHPKEITLYMYTWPGTLGFDVLLAMKAGIRTVDGYADFTDDASIVASQLEALDEVA
jgi:hypothetical protein